MPDFIDAIVYHKQIIMGQAHSFSKKRRQYHYATRHLKSSEILACYLGTGQNTAGKVNQNATTDMHPGRLGTYHPMVWPAGSQGRSTSPRDGSQASGTSRQRHWVHVCVHFYVPVRGYAYEDELCESCSCCLCSKRSLYGALVHQSTASISKLLTQPRAASLFISGDCQLSLTRTDCLVAPAPNGLTAAAPEKDQSIVYVPVEFAFLRNISFAHTSSR